MRTHTTDLISSGTVVIVFGVLLVAGCSKQGPEDMRRNLHLPGPDFVADAGRGRDLFSGNCVACHGERAWGTGQGPALAHKIYEPSHHPDMAFHRAVANGVKQHHWNFGDMPKIKTLTPEDVGHIIAYVRHEQREVGIR